MLEMSQMDPVPDAHTFHIVHPRGVPFNALIASAASSLNVPLVTYPEWLSRLSEAHQSRSFSATELERAHAANPALRLFSFFQSARTGPEWEPLSVARLDTACAVRVSKVLAKGVKPLGEENVRKWMSAWRASGFLPPQAEEVVALTEKAVIRASARDATAVVLATSGSTGRLNALTVLKGASVVWLASRFGFLVVFLSILQLLYSCL
jgi:alkylhydroperoxidase family enzyme